MARPTPIALAGSEFDAFLFAPIGEQGNGVPVSVLSALARLDVDPWQEAVKLAQLPRGTATQKLILFIEAQALTHPVSDAIATRLIELLPRAAGVTTSPGRSDSIGALIKSRPWWMYVILMSFMLGAQFIFCLLYTSPSPRDRQKSRMPSS